MARIVVAAVLALVCCVPAACADWSGDGNGDLLAVDGNGALLMYRGNGAGRFLSPYPQIGSGWGSFTALVATDWSGDGRPDLLARRSDGRLLMYRGNARGGFATGTGETIGRGWGGFTALLAPGDWNRDGRADVLARTSAGKLLLYRGNGAGGWVTGRPEPIGIGWGGFTALASGGDFSGDGNADILARKSDGSLLLYRGNGAGRFIAPYPNVGSGWNSLSVLTLVGQPRPLPPPPPAPAAPPVPSATAA